MTEEKSLYEQKYLSSPVEESLKLTMQKIQEMDNEKRFKEEINNEIDEKLKQASNKQKKTLPINPEFYTREEVAKLLLNVSVKTVERQLRDHKISGQQKVFSDYLQIAPVPS